MLKPSRMNVAGMVLCALLFFRESHAQKIPLAALAGRISDAETGNPVENAIVFLANTPIGTSSVTDGTFRISFVPAGVFQMVVARVGYRRELANLDFTKPESLYYEIKLQPQPVRTGEVEILGKRPAEAKPNLELLFPKESPGTYCLYGAANSMPIGIFFSDSAFYMYSLGTAIVDSEKYIRLWLLYLNLSRRPYEFDPLKCLKISMRGEKDSYRAIPPTSSGEMLAASNTDSAKGMISGTIGKFMRESSIQRSQFIDWNTRFDLKFGRQQWLGRNAPPDIPLGGINPNSLYGIFCRALNCGILERHTVFPGSGVHGYAYFPFPGLNWKATTSDFPEATEYSYTFEITTQSGSKLIEFVPQ